MLAVVAYVLAALAAVMIAIVLVRLIVVALYDGSPDTFGFGSFINLLMAPALVCVPLGLWKLTEIVLWLWRHVKVSW